MKKIKINKSVSTITNTSNSVKSLLKKNPSDKKLILKNPLSMNFIDFLGTNNYKNIIGKFYYKDPEFYNNTNIQNQLDFLVTNINNNQYNTLKSKSLCSIKKLPKLKSYNDIDDIKSQKIKSRKSSCDSPSNDSKTNKKGLGNKFPNISTISSVNFSQKNLNKSNKFNIKTKDDDFFYKNIFSKAPLFKIKSSIIDNKLNLVYCENESQYKRIMKRKKNLIKNKGTLLNIEEDSEKIKNQVNTIKTKIKFMKNIMDYSYPNFLLTKIKTWGKNLKSNNYDEKLTPIEEKNLLIKRRNNIRTKYLSEDLKVLPLKIL